MQNDFQSVEKMTVLDILTIFADFGLILYLYIKFKTNSKSDMLFDNEKWLIVLLIGVVLIFVFFPLISDSSRNFIVKVLKLFYFISFIIWFLINIKKIFFFFRRGE